MGISDLPNELLIKIFDLVQDVYVFFKLAQVCKKFQHLLRTMVLVLSDDGTQSRYFKSISSGFIPLGSRLPTIEIKSHSYFIIEYNKRESYNNVEIRKQLSEIIDQRVSAFHNVIDVFIGQDPLGGLALTTRPEPVMSKIYKTIVIIESKFPLKYLNYSQFELIGHEYDFHNVQQLPKIYLTVNETHDFRINSKQLKILNGIVNVSMTIPRLPPLLKFLEQSNIPNLETLNEISIEAGLRLDRFAKFKHLKNISLQSAFTGNLELQLNPTQEITTLQSLEVLKISGNAISLSSLSMPSLRVLKLELYGSSNRSFAQNLFFHNINCPELKVLDIHIGSLPGGLAYVTKELKSVIKNVEVIKLSSSSNSFPQAFEQLSFDHVRQLELKHSGIEVVEDGDDASSVNEDEIVKIAPEVLKFPRLESLQLSRSAFKLVKSFICDQVSYPSLKELVVEFRVEESPQEFIFDKGSFPELERLVLYVANRYGPLKKCDITIILKELPKIKSIRRDMSLKIDIGEDPYALADKIDFI